MKLDKKVTDFIKLEEGNIGRKSAVVTGAVLASTVLGAVLTSPAEAGLHENLPLDAPQLAGGRKAGAPKARVELRRNR
jgi:hypothetical protein